MRCARWTRLHDADWRWVAYHLLLDNGFQTDRLRLGCVSHTAVSGIRSASRSTVKMSSMVTSIHASGHLQLAWPRFRGLGFSTASPRQIADIAVWRVAYYQQALRN